MNTLTSRVCLSCVLLIIALMYVGCSFAQPQPTPTTQPDLSKSANLAATSTLTTSLSAVLITTVTPTSTTRLITRDALNIRNGPGLNFAVVGAFAAGAEARIVGRSDDGLWWQVACPKGVLGDMCWVIAESLFSDVMGTNAVPIVLAPPTPTITPTPSPTPCVPNAPNGWIAYLVRPGDTLSLLSVQTGVTIEQLAAINCLETDLLTLGHTILLPTTAYVADLAAPLPERTLVAISVGGGVSGEVGNEGGEGNNTGPQPEQVRPGKSFSKEDAISLGIRAILAGGSSGGNKCDSTASAQPMLHIGPNASEERDIFHVAETFVICVSGVSSPEQVRFKISPPEPNSFLFKYDTILKGWRWVALPDTRLITYTVTAEHNTQNIPSSNLSITAATTVTVFVLNKIVPIGSNAKVAIAGAKPGDNMYLFVKQATNSDNAYAIYWQLPVSKLNDRGEGYLEFAMLESDPVGFYVVGTGHERGNQRSIFGMNDPRVFSVVSQ